MQKLYKIFAFHKSYPTGFKDIIITEDGLNKFLENLKQAINDNKFEETYGEKDEVIIKDDCIEFGDITLKWEELQILTEYEPIDLISFYSNGYESTWLMFNP